MTVNAIFENQGFAVVSQNNGVYHLRRSDAFGHNIGEAIGLLFSEAAPTVQTPNIKLFLQDIEDGVSPARIIYHWQSLDARRFEETGLDPVIVTLAAEHFAEGAKDQRFMRPDGARVRHGIRLPTGEVVCYN